MQPTYLPWLGYFELIQRADAFVIYDHVQFEKSSWQQRNRIRAEKEILLTLPVLRTNGLNTRIKDIKIDQIRNPLAKHFKSIKQAYSKAINYSTIINELETIYHNKYEFLIDLNLDLIKYGMKKLNIEKELIFSSELNIEGQKVEALIDVCKKLKATHYYSPAGSKTYIDENNLFQENGIELSYQNYSHPVYKQINYPDFISHLSFIDYLFNTDHITL